jgi:hypothetical protein
MAVIVRFEVFTAVNMKNVFWNVAPCRSSETSVFARSTRRQIPEDGILYDNNFFIFLLVFYSDKNNQVSACYQKPTNSLVITGLNLQLGFRKILRYVDSVGLFRHMGGSLVLYCLLN